MTTVEQETEQPDIIDKGLLKVKNVHGVAVYVDPQNGVFSAKFSQGAGLKWFDRPTLPQLELLIAQHVLDFSGTVEVGSAPDVLVKQYEIEQLGLRLDPEAGKQAYSRIYKRRPTRILTGVQRRERHRDGTVVVFRRQDGEAESIEGTYVKPNPDLDLEFYELAKMYVDNLKTWKARFDELIARYEPITSQEIVDELRKQGARTGRA